MRRVAWFGLLMALAFSVGFCQEKGDAARKSYDGVYVAVAGNKEKIPHPLSKKTKKLRAKGKKIDVPEGMVLVPAGEFLMGEGNSEHKVWLDTYCIGKFEVTNAEWKAFIDATGFRPFPAHWRAGAPPEGKENHPVVYVSWEDAQKYCEWVSEGTGWTVRLPTEAEWEKAASWDPRKRRKTKYPWGDEWNAKLCNSGWNLAKVGFRPGGEGEAEAWAKAWKIFEKTEAYKKTIASGGHTTPVGSYKRVRTRYGLYDTGSGVWIGIRKSITFWRTLVRTRWARVRWRRMMCSWAARRERRACCVAGRGTTISATVTRRSAFGAIRPFVTPISGSESSSLAGRDYTFTLCSFTLLPFFSFSLFLFFSFSLFLSSPGSAWGHWRA